MAPSKAAVCAGHSLSLRVPSLEQAPRARERSAAAVPHHALPYRGLLGAQDGARHQQTGDCDCGSASERTALPEKPLRGPRRCLIEHFSQALNCDAGALGWQMTRVRNEHSEYSKNYTCNAIFKRRRRSRCEVHARRAAGCKLAVNGARQI